MRCADILHVIEEHYPLSYALDWDNCGLQTGRFDKDVQTIYIALDAGDAVIADAVINHADLLITHHPLLFNGIKQIHDQDFIGRRIIELIQKEMCCYAMHTNYDVLRMAEVAAQMLQLKKTKVLEATSEDGKGIGQYGMLPEAMPVFQLCEQIKQTFELQGVQVYGDVSRQVQRIAISPGAGNSMITHALYKQCDVLITGDISHHTGIDAVAQGLAVIDAGHYGIEHIFIQDMAAFLSEKLKGVKIISAPLCHPFTIV